jgi:uncharacterized protein YuzE
MVVKVVDVTYDPSVDAMYIKFREGKYKISEEVREGVIVDFDEENKVIGIEILDAAEKVSKESTSGISFKILEKAAISE